MKKLAKLLLAAVSMSGAVAVITAPVGARDNDIPPEPIPVPVDELDLSGTWTFETSQPTVSGACPAGFPLSGTAAVTQDGMNVTLRYLSGAPCRPLEVCSYAGTLDENNQFVVSNTVTVDDEGGTASNEVHLTIFDNGLAKGASTSRYVHPKGFECRWQMLVSFTRETEAK